MNTATTITTPDPNAEQIRSLIRQAHDEGCTALSHVSNRLDLLCTVGDLLLKQREQGGFQQWLALHFEQEELSVYTARNAVALAQARAKGRLKFESWKDVMFIMSKTEMLPGFDGASGSKKPLSHLTMVYKLHQFLKGLMMQELSREAKRRLKEDLKCIVEVYNGL